MGARLTMRLLRPLGILICWKGMLLAQEGGGQAEIGFQQYYLSIGSQRVANISGLAANYSQFIPGVGLLSASLSPALSNDRFQSGDNFLRLKGAPWQGQHWTIGVGDFELPGQLLPVTLANLYFPQITGRGVSVEATHGGRTFGFFYGTGTIANTPRVVLRLTVPQTLAGLYVRQQLGKRLLLGARFMHFSNDLTALQSTPYLLTQNAHMKTATQLSVDASYTIAGPLKWYSEATWSSSTQDTADAGGRRTPFSTLAGPLLESKMFTLRANYTFQSSSYFPVLGYYLGDREGPFGEVIFRPFRRLEVYGSASQYQNNVARDPALPTFRNSSESAGVSVQLPARVALTGQYTLLDLNTRPNAAGPWDPSKNQQKSATVSRAFSRHTLRLTVRDFSQASRLSPQRQRASEIEDILHIKHLTVGAGVRLQRLRTDETRTTVYYRGLAQLHTRRFSVYANLETGNDMQNRTLLATNTVSTTIYGGAVNLGKNWQFQAEAYRNNLITELNPQSIFVLQGQGVFVPGTLAALNQWSIYFRMTRKFSWGKAGSVSDMTQYAIRTAPLKGSIEGFVMQRLLEGNGPAEGIAVSLDRSRTILSDAEGRFHFSDVPEGPHKVSLSTEELLADYDPGPNKEKTIAVSPNKLTRADLDVIHLSSIHGRVTGPPDVAVDNIVIRMTPTERYTTPDRSGNFHFYNLHEGDYELAIDGRSLPEYAVIRSADRISIHVVSGRQPEPVRFEFELHKPEKTVRKVFEKKIEDQLPPPAPPPAAKPPVEPGPVAPRQAPNHGNTGTSPAGAAPRIRPNPGTPSRATVPSADAQKHNLAARQLTQAGHYREAIAELNEALRLAPDYSQAYNARGYARYLSRDYGAAIQDLNEAIRLNPNYLNAYTVRAMAKKATGDVAGTAADMKRAKELSQ
ncbi:MAG TPA: hypothetical protein VGH38_11270 [Bryobacteraceae bacterium]